MLRDQGGRRVLVDHHPRVEARARGEERREPAVEPRVDEQRGPPLADRAELGQGQLREVERQRDRLAVEVAPADDPAAAGRDRAGDRRRRRPGRRAGCRSRVELDVEDPPEVIERIAHRAVDLRHAAQRVRVLDLVGRPVVGALDAAVAQQMAELARRRRPGQDAAGPAGTPRRRPRPCRAAPRPIAAAATLAVRTSRSASASSSAPIAAHHLGPVEQREALLGLEGQRLQPGLAQGDAARARPARRPPPGRDR